jgi:23S rRNA A2030 N6-methylase RlmJ
MEMLAKSHPQEMPKEKLGYNRTVAGLYPSFSDAERDLFLVIRGLTRDTVRRANNRMSQWLRDNDDVLRLEDSFVDAKLADCLRVLRQHLSEWHALFLATEKDEKRSLVFLDDEFQTGTGFPRGIEDLVEAAVARARTSRASAG